MTLSHRLPVPVLLAIALLCAACQKVPAQTIDTASRPQHTQSAAAPLAPPTPPAPVADPSPAAPSANDLYQTWQQTNRTDHSRAYEAAQTYLKSYPDGPQASELTRWSAAFEKVTGRAAAASVVAGDTAPAPTPVAIKSAQGIAALPLKPTESALPGPPLAETEDWLVGWLGAHHHATPDSWAAWKFDGCKLYAVAVRHGCYRRSVIDFSEVDPSALKAYSITQGSEDSLAIMLRSSSQRPVYHADQAMKNLGSVQSPVPGGACSKETLDESPEPEDRTAESYFTANAATDPFAKDDIVHALNGVNHLVKLCGGKVSPF
jgi:hypothetical protein